MTYKYCTIQEISKWYIDNAEEPVPLALLHHMIDNEMITNIAHKCFSLTEINNFLLEKENCKFAVNDNGKFLYKKNRHDIISKYNSINTNDNIKPKFKIINIQGDNFKLKKYE